MTSEPTATASVPGRVVRDDVVRPGEGWDGVVKRGQPIRIVDQAGKQGSTSSAIAPPITQERYHAANTMKKARSILLTTGHVLYSDVARPMLTIVGDTCGRHDTIGGCCSAPSNLMMYGVERRARLPGDLPAPAGPPRDGTRRDIVANLNFFSNVPVGPDGTLAETVFVDGLSKAGRLRRAPGGDGRLS